MTLSKSEDRCAQTKPIAIPKNNLFDQQTAKHLLQTCACLIVEDFPQGSEFGIDLSIHYTGQNFMGIKMIPPGLHFVYFSFVKDGLVVPRTGFFHYFESQEIMITKWDEQEENIILDRKDSIQMERLKSAFCGGFLDTKLGMF